MILLDLVVPYIFIGLARAHEAPDIERNHYKCLFDEYSAHFQHEYKSVNEYEEACMRFINNLKRLNVYHVQSINNLIDIFTWSEERAIYKLNPILHQHTMPNTSLHNKPRYVLRYDTWWRQILYLFSRLIHKGRLAVDKCNDYTKIVYVRNNPIPILPKLPPSVDLRELGLVDRARSQGVCGCSWAMASAGLYEAMIRSTREYFKNDDSVDDVFKHPQFNASEQYFLNKSSSEPNNFCHGGNYLSLSLDLANNPQMDTVESFNNFPFTMEDTYENPDHIVRDFKRMVTNPFLPGNYVTISSYKTSLIYLYDAVSPTWTFRKAVKIMKSLLAQGIPIVSTLHISTLGDIYLNKIMMYHRGILDIPCKVDSDVIDHQVLIIGYGIYDGTEVWVVRNSWGNLWGSHGHFYVSIGKNSMCIERTMYTEVPAYFPLTGPDVSKPYAERRPADSSTIWRTDLQRGNKDALDPDPTENSPTKEHRQLIIIIATCTILILSAILVVVVITITVINKRRDLAGSSSPTESQAPVSIVSIRTES